MVSWTFKIKININLPFGHPLLGQHFSVLVLFTVLSVTKHKCLWHCNGNFCSHSSTSNYFYLLFFSIKKASNSWTI